MRQKFRLAVLVCISVISVALGACGSSDAAQPVETTIELTDGGRAANVQRIEVRGGAKVTLTVTSDIEEIIHVHGYELEFTVPAGGSVTQTFVADQLGSYEIETHKKAHIIAQLVVR